MRNKILKYFLSGALLSLLFACSSSTKLKSVQTSVTEFNAVDTPDQDSAVISEIAPYKLEVKKEMEGILIYSEQAMTKGTPEGLLGNLVADLTLNKARDYRIRTDSVLDPEHSREIDFCLLNNGGLRASLPKGEITRGNIFEVMPFGNEVVVVTLSGDKTKELFDFIAQGGGSPISGVKMGIKNHIPVNIMINEEPFDIKKNYRIATSDYLAGRGGGWDFFSDPIKIDFLKYKIRDAIIDYLIEENQQDHKLKARLDRRIYYVE